MRIAVAGSSGLIGTALVAALRAERHTVLRLVRRRANAPDERSWDPAKGLLDPSHLDGCDGVVNLCGAGIGDRRWTGAYKQEIRDSRIGPTELLADTVAAVRVPILVNASAVGFYGDTGGRIVDESAPAGTGFLADVCRDWEGATASAAGGGARVVRARSGVVLTPRGGTLGRLLPLYRLGLGGRLGSGRQYITWISLEDEVRGLIRALTDRTLDGPVNLCGPAPVTNAQFSSSLARAVHRPAPWAIPGFALSAVLGEFAQEGALTGQRAIPRELERSGFTFAHSTIGEVLSATVGSHHG